MWTSIPHIISNNSIFFYLFFPLLQIILHQKLCHSLLIFPSSNNNKRRRENEGRERRGRKEEIQREQGNNQVSRWNEWIVGVSEACAFPTAGKILYSSRPSFSPRVSHGAHNTRREKEKRLEKEVWICAEGQDTSSSKKKKDIGLLFQRFSSKLVVFVSARVLD